MPKTRGLTAAQREDIRMKEWQARSSRIVRAMMAVYEKTQADIAAVIKKTRVAVSERLHGRTAWTASELVLVADYFHADDLTRSALLGGKEKCRWEA